MKPLPDEVHTYHSLVPLEEVDGAATMDAGGGVGGVRRKWFMGCSSVVYRATNRADGTVVALRRIEGVYGLGGKLLWGLFLKD